VACTIPLGKNPGDIHLVYNNVIKLSFSASPKSHVHDHMTSLRPQRTPNGPTKFLGYGAWWLAKVWSRLMPSRPSSVDYKGNSDGDNHELAIVI